MVYTNTNIAAAGGVVTAMILTQVLFKKIDLTMALNGALAGLVSITAGPDQTNHFISLIIGAVGGGLVVFAVPLLDKLKIDDVVGAISVHLVAGIWGTLAVGIFGAGSLGTQIVGILAIGAFVVITTSIVWLALKSTVGIRVSDEEEEMGLDKSELGMEAYPEFGHGSQTLSLDRGRLRGVPQVAGRLRSHSGVFEFTAILRLTGPAGIHLPGFFLARRLCRPETIAL